MAFPSTVVNLPDPATRTEADGPTLMDKLVALLTPYKGEIEGLRTKVGYTSSADTSSLDYLVSRSLEQLAPYGRAGALSVLAGKVRFRFPWAVTILGTTAAVDTAPTGAAIILDVKRNGTTIYTSPGNRPTIAAGAFATATEPTPDVTAVAAGQYLTLDVVQVGSTVPGSDLTAFVRYRRT